MKRLLEWVVMIGVGCAVVAIAVWSAYHPGRISDQQFLFGVMTASLVAFLLKEHWRSRNDWRLWLSLAVFLAIHFVVYPVVAHTLRFLQLLIFLILEGAIAATAIGVLLRRKASLPDKSPTDR